MEGLTLGLKKKKTPPSSANLYKEFEKEKQQEENNSAARQKAAENAAFARWEQNLEEKDRTSKVLKKAEEEAAIEDEKAKAAIITFLMAESVEEKEATLKAVRIAMENVEKAINKVNQAKEDAKRAAEKVGNVWEVPLNLINVKNTTKNNSVFQEPKTPREQPVQRREPRTPQRPTRIRSVFSNKAEEEREITLPLPLTRKLRLNRPNRKPGNNSPKSRRSASRRRNRK